MLGRGGMFESIQPGSPEEDGLVWGWVGEEVIGLFCFWFIFKTRLCSSSPFQEMLALQGPMLTQSQGKDKVAPELLSPVAQ